MHGVIGLYLLLAASQLDQVAIIGDSTVRHWPRVILGEGPGQAFNFPASGGLTATVIGVYKDSVKEVSDTLIGEPGYGFNVILIAAGFNDLKQAGTPQIAYANLAWIFDTAIGEGMEVYFVPVLPSQAQRQVPPFCGVQMATIDELNALACAHPGVNCVAYDESFFWDRSSGTFHPEAYIYEGTPITYDNDCDGDVEVTQRYVHPSAAGCYVIATAVLEALGW